ncbi:MAG: hypothetical protein R3331_01970 [Sulfurospirillaceae bacterium]|nr:hypothetical protein [Sulfurospirillaceae bacterium]
MTLAYQFEYISINMVLENFLKVICDDFKIKYSINKLDTVATLFVSDTEERLHKFADYIAYYLPLSIFLKSTNAEVVGDIYEKSISPKECTIALPFTKRAITLAQDPSSVFFNNPFTPNEVGKNCENCDASLIFSKENNILIANNSLSYQQVYDEVADLIARNKSVTIKTPTGNFEFSKVSKKQLRNKNNFEIIPTDLSNVQKMVILDENEIRNLASIEKPIIRAKINSIYASTNILSQKTVKIRMPNTLLLQFICDKLYKIGVDFIVKTKIDIEEQYFIDYDARTPKIDDIEICVLENNEVLILKGHDDLPSELVNGLESIEVPAIKQYASILKERDLFNYKSSCFYFSKIHDDAIMFFNEKEEILEFVKFHTFTSIEEIFKKIEEEGKSGQTLVKNYKNTYPDIYEAAQDTEIPETLAQNLFSLFAFASIILGFSYDFEEAAEILIENAEAYGGQKGPRIEFSLRENNKIKSDFDAIKMIRSAMSFKLAGTEDLTLSFGFLDSFSYFLSDIADTHKATLQSSKITLGGSLFGYKRLTEMTCKNLLSSHKIYFNRELPIDDL